MRALLLRLVLWCLVPLFTLAAWLAWNQVQAEQSRLRRDASDRVANIATALDRLVEGRIAGLQLLAASSDLDGTENWANFYSQATQFQRTFAGHVIVADRELRMLLNTRVPLGGPLPALPRPLGVAAAPKALATRNPAVGDLFIGPLAQVPMVAVAVPVQRQGETRMLVINTLEAAWLQSQLDRFVLRPEWSLHLLDSTGAAVARRVGTQTPPAADETFRQALQQAPWQLVLQVAPGELRAAAWSAASSLAAAIACAALLSMLGVWRISRRLAASVDTLAHGAPTLNNERPIAEIEAARQTLDAASAARGAAEAALLASEVRYRELFEANPHPMWVYDLQTLAFLDINDAAIAHYGYSREEIRTMTLRDIRPPEDLPRLLKAIPQPGRGYNGGEQWRHIKKNGEIIDVQILAHTLEHVGRPAELVLALDITDRVRAEAEVERHRHHLQELVEQRTAELVAARARADTANQAKSAFLANMSHEIRTPLNAIIGLNELMLEDGATPKQADFLRRSVAAGRHLLAIVNDILDLSKIEAGHVQLRNTDFDLQAVFDEVVSIVGETAREKGLSLGVDISAVPARLRGDATRLRQAVLNLASNAVKFTHSGSVSLRARLLGETDGELLVRFEAQDTGIGVAASELTRLFQDFEQVDSSATRRFGGTGLGLAITKRLAELMRGEAGADSTPGVGSTFWFTARVQRAGTAEPQVQGDAANASTSTAATRAASAEPIAMLRQRHGQARILLAEDNAVNRELALAVLARAGLSADTADDGLEAVQKAQAVRYDLILMDMQMPVMDGVAAAAAIRELPDRDTVPILAMTANAFDAERSRCLAAGMDDFITKPVSAAVLFSTLLTWLDQRRR